MRRTLTALLLVATLLAGCGPAGSVISRTASDLARSDLPRQMEPAADADDVRLLAQANAAFALDLYAALRSRPGNLFFSPHSIAQALAMTYAGAAGETERQMREVLHYDLLADRVHPAWNALDLALASRAADLAGKQGTGFSLHTANALWGQAGHEFRPEFLDTLAAHHDAGMRLVDYVAAAEEARRTINSWVTEETEGRIEHLIPEGALSEITRLVLTNAIYFNASWEEPFRYDKTSDGKFFTLDGEEVWVSMMRRQGYYRYAHSAGYRAIDIPYIGGDLAMTVIVPDAGRFEAFQAGFDADQWQAIAASLDSDVQVELALPKFRCESEFSLSEALQGIGMTDAFAYGPANFSGMDGTRDLFISVVVHKAFVDVNEEGTEAAGATAVAMAAGGVPLQPVNMTIDRPFIYLIRDRVTGAVLFIGRVLNPVE